MKKPGVIPLLAGLWMALASGGHCQSGTGQFMHAAWLTSEGLPHNSASGTIQGSDGYLWIGTGAGVSRFDGVRFQNFSMNDGLPDHRVLSIMEDDQGRVWAGTERGVTVRNEGQWRLPGSGWPETLIWSLAQAGDGAVWLGTENGAWRSDDGETQPAAVPDTAAHPEVRDLLADGADGSMWILHRTELFHWKDGRSGKFPQLVALANGRELWKIQKAGNGDVWVCGDRFLAKREVSSSEWVEITSGMPDAEGTHIDVLPTADGTLWVATRNRGLRFLRDGEWRRFGLDQGLSHDDVRSISEDREGNLWVTTNGGGLNRLVEQQIEVFGRGRGLGRQVTTALALDAKGVLWAGTDGAGVMKLEGNRFVPGLPPEVSPPGYVWSLLAASDGALWVGTFRDGVLRWKDGKQEWFSMRDGLIRNWVPSLMEDRRGRVWIGTRHGGVHLWENGKISTLRGTAGDDGPPINQMLEDRNGTVWVATGGDGLFAWENGVFRREGGQEGLPEDWVASLHEDPLGRLWIGLGGSGLALREAGRFRVWTREQGLLSNSIQQIQSDHRGCLWIGTDNGLQRLSIAELLEVSDARRTAVDGVSFSRRDGLPTPQFTGGHGNLSLRDKDGTLWFSLAAGAVRVVPEFTRRQDQPIQLRIESASSENHEFWHFEAPGADAHRDNIAFPPGTGTVRLRFTATALRAPEEIHFQHRLSGIGQDWQDSSIERVAAYSSLPPGDYGFEVMAYGRESKWRSQPATIGFRIQPFFWQTMVFRFLLVVIGLGLLTAAVRWWSLRRIRFKMQLLTQERRVEKERSRIARDLHDDLGASLTEINFLGTLAADSLVEGSARDRIEGVVERARRMAKSLDEIVWTVNPANDTLASTANYLCSRTQESLEMMNMRCWLDVSEDLPEMPLDSELRHHLLMVVNEAVHNVMKHSGAGEVRLSIQNEGATLVVRVEDDGCGFDPENVPPGRNGLVNLRRRMDAVGGKCEIESAAGQGTRVRFDLPLRSPGTTRLG
jgi:ligand-binding sensor domain-containing protein/signal transduction histidine kinase